MGQVWRGQDLALQRPVAVKVLRSEYTGDPTFLARFRAEAQNAASLSSPNIAAVFDYGEVTAQDGTDETLAYLVMELVTGEPLSALLAREGGLDTATTLSILRQTGFALGEAHRAGMVHRDVKPGNILVCPDGHVKITDFGIAWSARSVALTRTGQVIGTPQFLSPEQAEGKLATPASDVYGLGLIGYECLTGRPAFEGDNPVTIALKQVRQDPEPLPGQLPAGVRTLITRALVKDPGARIPDGAAFVQAIEDVIAGRELPEPPRTVSAARVIPRAAQEGRHSTHDTGPVVRPPVRRRRRAGLAMVLLPLLGLLAGAGIAAAVLTAVTSGSPDTAAAAAAQQRQSGSIVFDAKDFLGRPVDQVTEQLSALGLNVELRADPGADVVPGMVTDVQPTAGLAPGDTVVVRYAAREPETGRGISPVTGAAVGNRATVDREPSARVAVTPAAPTSTDTTGSDTTGSDTLTGSLSDTSTTNESSGTRSTSPSTDTDTDSDTSSTSTSTSRSTSDSKSDPKSSSSTATSTRSSETTTSSKSHDD